MKLRGVYVPIVTPYAPDGSVDARALGRLAEGLLAGGAAGLIALGTAGEAMLLDNAERELVIDVCAEACARTSAILLVGAGSAATRASVEAVRALEHRDGVRGALCLVPYYLRPTQAGIRAHFEAIAAESALPVVIYNIPPRAGVRATAETLLELAATPTVVGVKQSAGPLDDDTMRLLSGARHDFAVLCGEDVQLAAMTLLGGAGGIAATAHLATRRWVAMVEAALAGDVLVTRRYHDALAPLAEACFAEPSPAVFKGVLAREGQIDTPDVRLPFLPATAESVEAALSAVQAAEAALA